MALFSEIANENVVIGLIWQGYTHEEISCYYQELYPGIRGLGSRSVRRYCDERDLRRLSNDDLDEIVEGHIRCYGDSYGRRMMQGSVRAMLGVTSRAISQRRISAACRRVAPDALNARTRDILNRTNPVPYFAPYFGYKGHFDQNEKIAQDFGCTHVLFVDGCSRFICGAIILPVKNPILIYHHLFRPILLRYGLFDQIRMDHGQEFCLCVFVQELLKEYRFDKRRLPWRQTQSTQNYVAERMWPEVNQRVNYPIKRVLVSIQAKEEFDFGDAVTKFCVSWLTMYTCQDPLQQLVDSWNFHRIPGQNGCVPLENMLRSNRALKIPEELVPTTEEVVRMYEERGGNLTRDGNFGIDPLALRPDLIESRQQLFYANQPTGQIIFSSILQGDLELFEHALGFLIELTMYLTRFLEN